MIKGFVAQTHELTEYEKETLLPVIISGLSAKVGKPNAVTNKYIVSMLKGKYKLTDARLRKIINHIRINGLIPCLIATSDGYYIAETTQELDDYIKSLEGRENAIKTVRLAMQKQRFDKLSNLFT